MRPFAPWFAANYTMIFWRLTRCRRPFYAKQSHGEITIPTNTHNFISGCLWLLSLNCVVHTRRPIWYDHVYFVSVIANPLRVATMSKSWCWWKRIMILEEDDDSGRAWWSWQSMMILADQHDPAGTAWFWSETKNLRSGTTLGPPRDHFGKIPKWISRHPWIN